MEYIICKDVEDLGNRVKKLVFSQRRKNDFEFSKISAKPFNSKQGEMWQIEKIKGTQAFHENYNKEEFLRWIDCVAKNNFSQCCITAEGMTLHYTIFPDKTKRKQTENKVKIEETKSHNKEKKYLLNPGENIQAFVDLGVFTKDFKVVNQKYDKYKQINRFIEIVDDSFKSFGKDEVTILDFGCGKSYLTFIIYYYFTYIKK